jgi:hypothetical protein
VSVLQGEAKDLRDAARALGDLLHEKCLAYGAAHNRQLGVWTEMLRPYDNGDGTYTIPASLVAHMPRLTRVLDRILRIVANPDGDRMGEDPWRDLAGDALAGVVMPRGDDKRQGCEEPGCEVVGPHEIHATFDAVGQRAWVTEKAPTPGVRRFHEEFGLRDAQPSPAGFDPDLDVEPGYMDDVSP